MNSLGRGALSADGNRFGYAGYESDFASDLLMHVRHRVYHAMLGRWTRRDPIGYVDGSNLYQYVASQPITDIDPMGLYSLSCQGMGGEGQCPGTAGIPHTEPFQDPEAWESHTSCGNRFASCGKIFFNAAALWAQERCNDKNNKSCKKWKVICMSIPPRGDRVLNAYIDPSKCAIYINNGVGCDTLAHELVHAGDLCLRGSIRTPRSARPDGPGRFRTCEDWICSEARAIAVGCCDYLSRGYQNFKQCYDAVWLPYVENWSKDPNCPNPAIVQGYCGMTEHDCGKEIPKWPIP